MGLFLLVYIFVSATLAGSAMVAALTMGLTTLQAAPLLGACRLCRRVSRRLGRRQEDPRKRLTAPPRMTLQGADPWGYLTGTAAP